MVYMVVLAVVALVVAVGVLQNGQAVTVSFLFWQFQAPLALVMLAATAAGLAIGILVGWARALGRWRHRATGPSRQPDVAGPTAATR